jgi:hypothetical protein
MLDQDVIQKPELIFDIDEEGYCHTLHKQQTILAPTDSWRAYLVGPEHGENVTQLYSVAAQ